MSETIDTARPRKRDAEGTRGRILAAAMTRFARFGYEGTSLRDISADAGADVALVSRYFGGKEGLFTEALKASFNPRGLTDRDRRRYAREMAERLAGDAHADDEAHHRFQFLLRAATSPATAPLLNVAVQERFLGPIRDWLGGEDAQPRARARRRHHRAAGRTADPRLGARGPRTRDLRRARDSHHLDSRVHRGKGTCSSK